MQIYLYNSKYYSKIIYHREKISRIKESRKNMKEIIIQINERNYINRYNELKIIKSKPSEIDPIMISMVSKRKRKEKGIRLERECNKIKSIINQIQREMIDAIKKGDDREIDRLIEVRGYYMRDLKNTEKELRELSK